MHQERMEWVRAEEERRSRACAGRDRTGGKGVARRGATHAQLMHLAGSPSQKIALQLKATLENVTNLRPVGEDFRWYLKVRLEGPGP